MGYEIAKFEGNLTEDVKHNSMGTIQVSDTADQRKDYANRVVSLLRLKNGKPEHILYIQATSAFPGFAIQRWDP